jgi:solute carrier family 32 (vesicular inhibitory amino acid transporter)
LTGPLIFILPPLFYTKMLQLEKHHDKRMLEEALSEADLNDTEMLLSTSRYGTIPSPKREIYENEIVKLIKKIWKLLHSECMLASVVIVFGIAATFTSTFYNVKDINSLSQFWSPCIQNISLSYQLIPK